MKRMFCIVFLVLIFWTIQKHCEAANSVSQTINAEDMWTASISPTYNNIKGNLNISVIYSDTGSATTKLQRTFNNGITWGTVKSYSASAENQLVDQEAGVKYRIGVDVGEYESGTITVRLSN